MGDHRVDLDLVWALGLIAVAVFGIYIARNGLLRSDHTRVNPDTFCQPRQKLA